MGTTAKTSKNGFRDMAEGTFTGYHIDPRKIVVEKGYNARNFDLPENQEHVEALARMIRVEGVQTPLVVRHEGGKIILVDGESRLRATMKLIASGVDIKTVPATLEDKKTSAEDRIASLITRNEGKALNILERSEVFARLKKYGWTEAQIADKTGITATHVNNILLIQSAPQEMKNEIAKGTIKATFAAQLLRDHKDNAVAVMKDTIKNAREAGKTTATAKHVTASAPAKRTRGENKEVDPLAFTRAHAKQMFAAMAEIYFDKDAERPRVLNIIRNVFEDVVGSDWKDVAKDFLKSL